MDTRVAGIEATVQTLADKLDAFSGRIAEMFGIVDKNDIDAKRDLKDKLGIVEEEFKKQQTELQATMSNIQGVMTTRNTELNSITSAIAAANQEHGIAARIHKVETRELLQWN